jgi:hypothetical protein
MWWVTISDNGKLVWSSSRGIRSRTDYCITLIIIVVVGSAGSGEITYHAVDFETGFVQRELYLIFVSHYFWYRIEVGSRVVWTESDGSACKFKWLMMLSPGTRYVEISS